MQCAGPALPDPSFFFSSFLYPRSGRGVGHVTVSRVQWFFPLSNVLNTLIEVLTSIMVVNYPRFHMNTGFAFRFHPAPSRAGTDVLAHRRGNRRSFTEDNYISEAGFARAGRRLANSTRRKLSVRIESMNRKPTVRRAGCSRTGPSSAAAYCDTAGPIAELFISDHRTGGAAEFFEFSAFKL
ncbi:hypothetical protein EVAR_95358_1 [Eumeta japonica]|uniref:Uncharacterized protein n=1 Tax=Eumeta variegata TaxID=151549 RepID=A0A4C1UA65_EUMVA|nr:hypothetical protein EVAR_95358_1 [Eumeta japonica]